MTCRASRGIAVNAATGRATVTPESPEVFREQASPRLANIQAAARRAPEARGGVVIR